MPAWTCRRLGRRSSRSRVILGPHDTPPRAVGGAQVLVLESPVGNRMNEDRRARRQRLQAAQALALANQGKVLIPAFSIGRTEERMRPAKSS